MVAQHPPGPAARPGLLDVDDSRADYFAAQAALKCGDMDHLMFTKFAKSTKVLTVKKNEKGISSSTLRLGAWKRKALSWFNLLSCPNAKAEKVAPGPWALPQLCHPSIKGSKYEKRIQKLAPAFVHPYDCACSDLSRPCNVVPSDSDLEICAMLELAHPLEEENRCSSTVGPVFHAKHGLARCVEVELWALRQDQTPIGNGFDRDFFRGSPQEHAVLNRHLIDYFKGRARSQQTTPYNVPASQRHLLAPMGMEEPQPDAPEACHALHKSIEEHQLRGMRLHLQENLYGLISVKDSKLHLLPKPASIQNPVHQAKDVSRYPGSAVDAATFDKHDTYFMHDVSSEVGPHELVERLAAGNPNAHLFVTGINPIEVVDRAGSFEPASHEIDYDLGGFNFVFTGSESEAYFTPIDVTVSWLRTSSVRASDGMLYQVVLLDYKLGHCLWHIFRGDVTAQDSRTFPTGSYVRVPAVLTGTLQDEWLPTKLISAVLSFTDRTPDLSTRNIAAKVAQLATSVTPRLTSKEMWIAQHLARERAPIQTLPVILWRGFWRCLYAVTFQWHLLAARPDVYSFVDERRRYRVLHPTEGGGWRPPPKNPWVPRAIPNKPTWLMFVSAFTSSVFTFVLPKIFLGEIFSNIVLHVPLRQSLQTLIHWMDLKPLRLLLTAAIIAVTSILPGHIVKVFTRLSGHFWRLLWLPSWAKSSVRRVITEICGGPGASLLCWLPGRGWAMQSYLWAIALFTVFPGAMPCFVVPWLAFKSGAIGLLLLWWVAIALENYVALAAYVPFEIHSRPEVFYGLRDLWHDVIRSDWDSVPVSFGDICVYSGGLFRHYLSRLFFPALNYVAKRLVGSIPSRGSIQPLPARGAVADIPRRERNVDRHMPSVTVLPARIPAVAGAPALAVDPVGMTFVEWLAAVKAAYAVESTRYPLLTPGQSCFWDCLSSFGGTPHMWYSWFMAFTGGVPDPGDVVGQVSQSDIMTFSSASRMGISMTGAIPLVTQAADSWPVVNMVCSYLATSGLYHVELAMPTAMNADVSKLARFLCTLRNHWPAWFHRTRDAIATSPLDGTPAYHASLRAMMGDHELPVTRAGTLDALLGSYSCAPVDPRNQEGYAIDFAAGHDVTLELVAYNAPVSRSRIGNAPSATIWKRFRMGAGTFRAKVDRGFSHPSAEDCTPVAIGATHASDRVWRNNVVPKPPRWRELQTDLQRVVSEYVGVTLPAVPLSQETFEYTADVARACRLVADLRAHPSVLESFNNPVVIQSLDSIVDTWRASGVSRTVNIKAYFGVWGSGKTTATAEYMRSLPDEERRQVRVVSHTESLRAQSKLALDFEGMRGFNFPTLASIITEPSTGTVVFDDAGKFWGGMLDLVILCNPLVHDVVLNGDPAQGLSQFPVAGTQSQFDANPLSAVQTSITKYATITHRGFRSLADTLGVHTTNPVEGHLTHTVAPKIGLPVLTSSPRYAGVLISSGRKAYTFASVQGEDFTSEVEVDITALEDAVLDRSAYVALTRSKTGCYVHLPAMDPTSNIKSPPTASDLMNALVYAMRSQGQSKLMKPDALIKAAFYRHLATCMPSLPWFARIGASVDRSEFQSVFPATSRHQLAEARAIGDDVSDAIEAVAPPAEDFVRETHWHAKEDREVQGRGGATDQFKETAFINPHDHKRKDTATYFLSVQRRLKTMSAKANARRMARCSRRDMCDEYDKMVPKPPQWTALKHDQYCDLAVEEYEKARSLGAVRSKLQAHDPDRTGSDIKISLKNQVIKKDEKRRKVEAIPGQLIHEYDISQTLADAPFALFLENELFDAFPANYLFYRRMNPQQFIEEYKKRWRVDNGVHTSDVTRWDVGCDAGVLNFDVHVMHRSGFPKQYIEGYIERRLSSRSQHGPMATMQNSGDRYTWSMNSIRRAVVTSLINEVTSEDTVAINGDDEAMDRFSGSKHFPDSPWEFKNQNGHRGEFSGFELGGPVPTYSAEGIHYRTLILESRDPSAQNKWLNYLGLLQWANLEDPLSLDVARSARRFMQPALFAQALPAALRPHFDL